MFRAVNDFKLSDEENLAIFEGIIVPHFLGDLSPCEEPVAYFTGGQPGAVAKIHQRKLFTFSCGY